MYTAEHKRCGDLQPSWSGRAIQVTTHITFFTFVPTLWLPSCEHRGALGQMAFHRGGGLSSFVYSMQKQPLPPAS